LVDVLRGCKEGGYWVTTRDIANLIGVKQAVIYRMMETDVDWPEAETFLGRSQVWDRSAMVSYLKRRHFKLNDIRGLGLKKPVVPPGDELLILEEVMDMLGYKARAEFQMRVNQGHFVRPDFYYKRPFPSFWLKSSILAFLKADKPFITYKQIEPGHYRVFYGKQEKGSVYRRVKGTRYTRKRDGSLKEEDLVEWLIKGKRGSYSNRKKAAWALVQGKP